MGEIADGIIDGDFDSVTGEYLGRGGGYPRTMYQQRKSEDLSWKKVVRFMNSIGIKNHLQPQVVKDFGCKYSGKSPLRNACFQILPRFDEFKKFAEMWVDQKKRGFSHKDKLV